MHAQTLGAQIGIHAQILMSQKSKRVTRVSNNHTCTDTSVSN